MSDSLTETFGTDEPLLGHLLAAQTDPRIRWPLTLTATLVGLALATVHWGGIVLGGAVVGLCWPTLRRALLAGLAFGLVVVLVTLAQFALAGSLDEYLAMGPLLAISVAVPLVAGTLGGAVRGLLTDAPL